MKRLLTGAVERLLAIAGYRIERVVGYEEHTLDLFELLVPLMRPESREFFFVQVGAHDGRSGDPLHKYVIRYHWRGLCLEPHPAIFEKLCETYRDEEQVSLENVALAEHDGQATLYTVPRNSQLSTLRCRVAARRVRGSRDIVEVQVKTSRWESLVMKHGISHVDLLVVDTEGSDDMIVRTVLNSGVRPVVARYEHLHLTNRERRRCARALAEAGYSLYRQGRDTIAIMKERLELS